MALTCGLDSVVYESTQRRPSSAHGLLRATRSHPFGRGRCPLRADDLDATARLRVKARSLIRELRTLGVSESDMANRSILELDEMRNRAYRRLMGAPQPGR